MIRFDGYHTLLIDLTQLFPGSYVLLLIEFRPPQPRWKRLWIDLALLVVCANLVAVLAFDFWDVYYQGQRADSDPLLYPDHPLVLPIP